jgi:hypothetical protein
MGCQLMLTPNNQQLWQPTYTASKIGGFKVPPMQYLKPGNTKRGSITVMLTSCMTGLESAVMTTDNFCVYLQN